MYIEGIQKAATKRKAPDGREYASLVLAEALKLARKNGMTLGEIETEALGQGIIPERYQRSIGTIGCDGQRALILARVGIAGAGGLGGTLAEILARYGVGHLTIIDFDTFEESNLNRQILSNTELLGRPKVAAAVARIATVNPATSVVSHQARLNDENTAALFQGADLIADALGNVVERFVLQRAARSLAVPLVHAAVAGTTGQLLTVFPGDRGLDAVYGSSSTAPRGGREASEGTPPSTVCAVAALQAHEIMRIITGATPAHRNRLTIVNIDDLSAQRFAIPVSDA